MCDRGLKLVQNSVIFFMDGPKCYFIRTEICESSFSIIVRGRKNYSAQAHRLATPTVCNKAQHVKAWSGAIRGNNLW